MKTLCSVPAKLILSGEHAVLYQCPALSMAIDLKTHCWSEYQPAQPPSITIKLSNFNQTIQTSFKDYRHQANQIEQRYQQFEQKNADIQTVFTQPSDLILSTLHHFETICPLKEGTWHFTIESNVPIGRGLGSSAAVILCLLGALFKQHQMSLSKKSLLALAQTIENRQHGRSSGIDPATLLYAGLLRYQQTQQNMKPLLSKLSPPPLLNSWLIDTGKPDSLTGQCVVAVQKQHQHNALLWQNFTNTTQQIERALMQSNQIALKENINNNHQLLMQIGVVPKKIQTFIATLQNHYNAVAKLCGAGAVSGENAGVIFCISEQDPSELCQTYGYSCQPITLQTQGLICEIIEHE